MTQSIVQGPEDPLLVLDHQGGSGNPSFVIQQDENAAAYIWWDQVNQTFNMGPASSVRPSLQMTSDGTVYVDELNVVDLTVRFGLVKAAGGGFNVMGGMLVDDLTVTGDVRLQGNILNNVGVTGSMGVGGNIEVEGDTVVNHLRFFAGGFIVGDTSVDGSMNVIGNVSAANFLQSSSKEIKENIADLSSQEALETLEHLNPVKFNLKADNAKKVHHGFIAENVPPSVASSDGKSISLMDIVAVLTQVVKEQQKTIKEQQKTIDALVAKGH